MSVGAGLSGGVASIGGGANGVFGAAGHGLNSWWVVKGSNGNVGIIRQNANVTGSQTFGLSSDLRSALGGSLRGYYIGSGATWTDVQSQGDWVGTKLANAFQALGASPMQVSGITAATDSGAVQQGGTATILDPTGKGVSRHNPGPIGSEAQFSPIIPDPGIGLGGSGGILIRALEVVGGMVLLAFAVRELISGDAQQLVKTARRVLPV